MKKWISLFVALSVLMSNIGVMEVDAKSAFVSKEVCDAINYELSEIEIIKDEFGMENVNFGNLYVGAAIPVYHYEDVGLVQKTNAYLLYENDIIVAFLYENSELCFQMMPIIADKIRNLEVDKCALVYDVVGCYLYDGEQIHFVGYGEEVRCERKDISYAKNTELSKIKTGNLLQRQYLNYISRKEGTRATNNYACNVNYVSQLGYENLCWAASIAMIVNYLNGTSLQAVNVALRKFPTGNFNRQINATEAMQLLATYGVNYAYNGSSPSVSNIMLSLNAGYPVYGHFRSGNGESGHATVIYWLSATGVRLMVMDPMYGSIEVTSTMVSGTRKFSYVTPYSGVTLELVGVGYDS